MMISAVQNAIRSGQWAQAEVLCKQSLQAMPGHPMLHAMLGTSIYNQGRIEESIEPLKRAIALDPRCWQAGAVLASAYDRLSRYREAFETARDTLRVNPNLPKLQKLVDGLRRFEQTGATDGEVGPRPGTISYPYSH